MTFKIGGTEDTLDCAGGAAPVQVSSTRKVDARLPGKGNSTSHGARPVHLVITMMKWIRTGRLSMKDSFSRAHLLALCQTVRAPQSDESGLYPTPNLTDVFGIPSMSSAD